MKFRGAGETFKTQEVFIGTDLIGQGRNKDTDRIIFADERVTGIFQNKMANAVQAFRECFYS